MFLACEYLRHGYLGFNLFRVDFSFRLWRFYLFSSADSSRRIFTYSCTLACKEKIHIPSRMTVPLAWQTVHRGKHSFHWGVCLSVRTFALPTIRYPTWTVKIWNLLFFHLWSRFVSSIGSAMLISNRSFIVNEVLSSLCDVTAFCCRVWKSFGANSFLPGKCSNEYWIASVILMLHFWSRVLQ